MVEAHAVRKHYYRLGVRLAISGVDEMKVEETVIGGRKYYIIYTQRALADRLLEYVCSLKNPHIVNHVAVVPKLRRLYVAARLDRSSLGDFLKKTYELALELA